MIQKDNRFGFCPEFLRNPFHRRPPWFESEDHDRFSVLPASRTCLVELFDSLSHNGAPCFKTPFQAILKELGKDVQSRFS
jgi:hypothetical protein